jgi:hypothetical protein
LPGKVKGEEGNMKAKGDFLLASKIPLPSSKLPGALPFGERKLAVRVNGGINPPLRSGPRLPQLREWRLTHRWFN